MVFMLFGVSAFAERRHSNGTISRGKQGGDSGHGRSAGRATVRSGNDSATPSRSSNGGRGDSSARSVDRGRSRTDNRNDRGRDDRGTVDRNRNDRGVSDQERGDRGRRDDRAYDRGRSDQRTYDRNRNERNRNERGAYDRNHDRGSGRGRDSHDSTWRGSRDSRSRSRSSGGWSHGNRQPYYAHGRVSRAYRHGHGYHVWIHGVHYPFFIPSAYYHHNRFRVGLFIRLGGYYNNAGYYDYYGGASAGTLYGVVESVDYRRGTFVLRNDATGSFVTVVMTGRSVDVRPGDSVELSGDWTRSGLFQAYDVYFN